MLFTEHHESHAASAFFPSPFESAAILTIDGVGEWATSSYGYGRGNEVHLLAETHFPHSLGLLYSAFTYYTGFKVNSGEYKVMGLAPYGEPRYVQKILDELIDLREDGSLRLNMKYFNYCQGLTMTNRAFDQLFDGPPRKPETRLTQREMDLARSVQEVTELAMLRMARHVHARDRREESLPGGRRGAQLRRQRPHSARGARSKKSGFSPRPATPAARWARRCRCGISIWAKAATSAKVCGGRSDGMKAAYLGPVVFGGRDSADSRRATARAIAGWTAAR